MPFVRTILALLIALSVALLPAAGAGAFKFQPEDMTEMSVSEPMDCCPHAAGLCDIARSDCTSMAACAVNCLNCASGTSSALVYPVMLAVLMPLFEGDFLHSQLGSPPFRPPRV
jgi:hypothetical protein